MAGIQTHVGKSCQVQLHVNLPGSDLESARILRYPMPIQKSILLHRLLREVLKHYTVMESHCSQTGVYDISHRGITINFLDLQHCLESLAPRQKEAVFWFVIQDEKQKLVAQRMKISTVTVGQYVESACQRIAKQLWPEHYGEDGKQMMDQSNIVDNSLAQSKWEARQQVKALEGED